MIWREKIVEINIEGIEDIDITTKDDEYIFLQAKNFQNVYDSSKSTVKLKNTLRSLSTHTSNQSNIESLIYVTNSTVPFPMKGKKTSNSFDREYVYYRYKSLTPDVKKKIEADIDDLIASPDDKISSEVKANLWNFKIEDNLEKFGVIKFRYEGDDWHSKIDVLRKEAERIITLAQIPVQQHGIILGAWQELIIGSATNANVSITKSQFIGQTLNASIFYRSPVEDFADIFKLSSADEDILRDHHKHLMERLNEKYDVISVIYATADETFRSAAWANLSRDTQRTKFVNEFSNEMGEMAGFDTSDPCNLLLAKFAIWSIIKHSAYMNGIREAFA